jgi:hypothetical protein
MRRAQPPDFSQKNVACHVSLRSQHHRPPSAALSDPAHHHATPAPPGSSPASPPPLASPLPSTSATNTKPPDTAHTCCAAPTAQAQQATMPDPAVILSATSRFALRTGLRTRRISTPEGSLPPSKSNLLRLLRIRLPHRRIRILHRRRRLLDRRRHRLRRRTKAEGRERRHSEFRVELHGSQMPGRVQRKPDPQCRVTNFRSPRGSFASP